MTNHSTTVANNCTPSSEGFLALWQDISKGERPFHVKSPRISLRETLGNTTQKSRLRVSGFLFKLSEHIWVIPCSPSSLKICTRTIHHQMMGSMIFTMHKKLRKALLCMLYWSRIDTQFKKMMLPLLFQKRLKQWGPCLWQTLTMNPSGKPVHGMLHKRIFAQEIGGISTRFSNVC